MKQFTACVHAFGSFVELDGYLWEIGTQLNNIVLLVNKTYNLSYSKDTNRMYNSGSSSSHRWLDVDDVNKLK